ncbi:hypothetical protein B0A48_18445 [Cryoendolithus antarcticus]|uniref:Uncharacterized protein n=1 Tax=Cryoendolithus antarcticus TaxID=1507870 RepID=A0A1V8S9M2_9PEZI|nr:hypothetical protein B0A48_18445 [Cryoendolithus antarcticus]
MDQQTTVWDKRISTGHRDAIVRYCRSIPDFIFHAEQLTALACKAIREWASGCLYRFKSDSTLEALLRMHEERYPGIDKDVPRLQTPTTSNPDHGMLNYGRGATATADTILLVPEDLRLSTNGASSEMNIAVKPAACKRHFPNLARGHLDYRLLFPFEDDPETEGMWWEVDYHKKRWRTVSWQMYDPEHWQACHYPKPQTAISVQDEMNIVDKFTGLTLADPEVRIKYKARNESASQTAAKDATILSRPPSGLTGNTEPTSDKRSKLFDSFCVSNSLEDAQKVLVEAANAKKLVNGEKLLNGQPLLLAVVEEGHRNVVEFLLNHGAELDSRDWNGNTALLRALGVGRGTLAETLIAARANFNASNNDGLTIKDIARASLELQEESARIEYMMVHPREPPLVHIGVDNDRLQKNLDARRKEICALQQIIACCEQRQIKEQVLVRLRTIGQMYGEEQAQTVERYGQLDDRALLHAVQYFHGFSLFAAIQLLCRISP